MRSTETELKQKNEEEVLLETKKRAATKRTAKSTEAVQEAPVEKTAVKATSKRTTTQKKTDKSKRAVAAESEPAVPKKKAVATKKTTKQAKMVQSGENKSSAKKGTYKKGRAAELSRDKTLIIVESPAKARTLEKILGPDYHVEASVGHVRDLPKGRIGIDIDNGFKPEYIQTRGKAPIIKTLKEAASVSKQTLLASDPDREGEAISWHLAELLDIDPKSQCRIRMQEITDSGVRKAVAEPDTIDLDKVNAQQSRRVLDRLVGYQLSPLLWYKIQRGLSAGRVQSVALRIVCEREKEIEAFVPQEYWLIDALASSSDGRHYVLRVEKHDGKRVQIENKEQALEVESVLKKELLRVTECKTKENSRTPLPPFKTSVLQQEASRRLGYSPRRTMGIAQSLYEGVDVPGRGPVGLITYMRTDSLRLSPEAVEEARRFILEEVGENYLPAKANSYAPGAKAQDAHEAIRPTDPFLTPQSIKSILTPEQYRLYEMIWNRFMASQMAAARMARTTILADCGQYGLKQQGIVVLFDGWGKFWPLGVKDVQLDVATPGELLTVDKIKSEQKFTLPPSRYTDAGLVKVLEEKGIGRPSTYATIMETLSNRGYVERGEEDKKLIPTDLGRVVCDFLIKYFPKQIDVAFTANMETLLDKVEDGELAWTQVLQDFWSEFKPVLDEVTETAEKMPPPVKEIGEDCPECGKPLLIRRGRFGEFIACSGFPECRYTRKIIKTIGIKCPKCGEGELVRRRVTKGKTKGRFFYGCSRYPDCDFVAWKKPGDETPQEGEATYEREDHDL